MFASKNKNFFQYKYCGFRVNFEIRAKGMSISFSNHTSGSNRESLLSVTTQAQCMAR